MSAENEFVKWLQRPEKMLAESIRFAIRSWQAVEFQSAAKYEIVLNWIADVAGKIQYEVYFPTEELTELMALRAQPGLVSLASKRRFVNELLKMCSQLDGTSKRIIPEFLIKLNDFEIIQDLFRSDYTLHTQLYRTLLLRYQQYLVQFRSENSEGQPHDFFIAEESDFFLNIIQSLINCVKRVGDRSAYSSAYNSNVVQPLVNVLLEFRIYSVSFFNEFLELEQLLYNEMDEKLFITRLLEQPLHVTLLILECGIISRRGVELFLHKLIRHVFKKFERKNGEHEAEISLYLAAYTLEMFRKHEIHLKLEMMPKVSGLDYIGENLFSMLKAYKEKHLSKVLMVLCGALRLNPLILEKFIFQLTIWMIVTNKEAGSNEMELYEKYLELLMDMFRRLSRTEKFVGNLLKVLKEWLDKFGWPQKKRKSGGDTTDDDSPKKKPKYEDDHPIDQSEEVQEPKETEYEIDNFYVQLLFKDFYKLKRVADNYHPNGGQPISFPYLQNAWPTGTVGVSFAKLVTCLMSKPSLVVSKTLLYSLQSTLSLLESQSDPEPNMLFFLDLQVALLCEYFDGCKLTEQMNKFTKELSDQYELTIRTLKQFGNLVFNRQDHRRLISAFLEINYHAANYHLLLTYYQPDGSDVPPMLLPTYLHDSLSLKNWEMLEKRVNSFRGWECKFLFNRLALQRVCAQNLLTKEQPSNLDEKLSVILHNVDEMKIILRGQQSKWLIKMLGRSDKVEIAKSFCLSTEYFHIFVDDLELLALLGIAIYSRLVNSFKTFGKCSLLAALKFDFGGYYARGQNNEFDSELSIVYGTINAVADIDTNVELPSNMIEEPLKALAKLPLSHLRLQSKRFIFGLHLALYRDLKYAGLKEHMNMAESILTDLLHFGQKIPVFKYIRPRTIVILFPASTSIDFYNLIFASISEDVESASDFFISLYSILYEALRTGDFHSEHRQLMLLAIRALTGQRGPVVKHFREHLVALLKIYAEHVKEYFISESDGNAKSDSKFVEKTLSGFAPMANYMFSKMTAAGEQTGEQIFQLDENFRRIFKIYLGHSVNNANDNGIELLQVALSNRKHLHLDQDEIEVLLSKLWPQLESVLKDNSKQENILVTESMIKLVIDNKTNEDILLIMKVLRARVEREGEFRNVTRLLTLISKCHFSVIKGAIFNEQFKQITQEIMLRLLKDERQQFIDHDNVLSFLFCLHALVENRLIPISMDTLDSILGFLMNINIKRFEVTDNNTRLFHDLHFEMSEVCLSLVKQRHILLMDRVPQFMHIFKDLLQAIVLYKSERHKDTDLLPAELDDLADLAAKLEALSRQISYYRVHVKRVAPFVLTFAINVIVTSTRSTTLYPKIKTHIESICHDFIGLCDHHTKGFILRCSNEGGRQLYEALVKDFNKYHKFKGKI